ncbi:plasmid recombination protein [Acidovorax sp. Root275]|uniref:plasmid recombination protein n=1 Tax=Acidovorax sp. Root275 TaxID=1736508 RepID=UPI000ACD706F|nr:plasmid recombination protein [Acidovorax sp. Root275]
MAENIAHFAVKSIGLSRVNGRKPCTLLEAARHNLREIQAEQGATGHIDPTRTHCNSVLHGPATAAEVCAQAEALQTAAGIVRGSLRRDHCQAIEAVFSLPQQAAVPDPADYFAKCLAWLAGALALPVLSAVVHCDESAKHLHVLLLPVKDGAHVGSAPIDRAALKRLRERFFSKVAGPAGLKHAEAKVRGVAKQWAIAAVFRRCEVLGLSAANGPLWPCVVASIERDPTAAMLALGIDANTIRPSDKPPQSEPPPRPIGIESNPIGFQKEGEKPRTLSCVGFTHSPLSKQPLPAVTSLGKLWDTVGRRSQWTAPHQDRLRVARAAQQQATARHSHKLPKQRPAPAVRIGDDGLTRERDEYSHDLSAWD